MAANAPVTTRPKRYIERMRIRPRSVTISCRPASGGAPAARLPCSVGRLGFRCLRGAASVKIAVEPTAQEDLDEYRG